MNPNYMAPPMRTNALHNPLLSNTAPPNLNTSEGMANNVNAAMNQLSNMSIHNPYEKNINLPRDHNVMNGQMGNKPESTNMVSNCPPHIPTSSVPAVLNGNFINANVNSEKYLLPQQPLPNQPNQQPGSMPPVGLQSPIINPVSNADQTNTHGSLLHQNRSNLLPGQFLPNQQMPPHLPPQNSQMQNQTVQVSKQSFLLSGPPNVSQQSVNPMIPPHMPPPVTGKAGSEQISTQPSALPPQVQSPPGSVAPTLYQTNQMNMMPPQQFNSMPPKVNSMPMGQTMQNQQVYGSIPPHTSNMGQVPLQPDQMAQPPQGGQPLPYGGNMNHPYNVQAQAKNAQYVQPRGPMYPVAGTGMMPPTQPGYAPAPYPSQSNPYQQPQQQARRLDPDQMPSPIQVTNDDQKTRGGVFATDQKGAVPPLVTTNFIVQDQGNASPRYIRSSMYNVATTSDMMKQTSVPFGLIISPFAKTLEQELVPPIVNLGELGPVRCIRCKAYMCPFMQFIDSGRRFQCLFCKATTEVPNEYFQHLDQYGLRMDRYERPELMLGTYEFVATKDYCRNNQFPKPPAVIFLIDVSYNNIKSGLVNLLCSEMKNIIKNLPTDQGQSKSNMKVGFITYNNTVHFYNIKSTLAQPQMLVVGDIQEMFMPLLDGFLCDPEESDVVIDTLMQQIPAMFASTRETETLLAPAIEAGLAALKASECTGKLLLFHSTLPVADAPGKLKNRDDRKLLGTDKEKSILTPQCNDYTKLGQECVSAGCSVDLFLFNNSYIDIATIGQVSRITGGEVYKYTYFLADMDGQRLITDIVHNISRPVAFDAIMRVRTSTGIRPTDFFGHFYMPNTTDMELASIDCDKAIAIEIKHDDKLSEEEGVYIQVALLYTSCGGQRRLRIINLSLKTCSQMTDLYRSCDLDTVINYFAKQAMIKMLDSTPKAYKEDLVNRCAQILACYRKNCASPSSAGQLILPECMKLLPLYMNCLLKSDALSGGADMTIDDRSFVMQAVMTMDLPSSVAYFYPRLISLHDLSIQDTNIPSPIRCSIDKMTDDGAYLLENGIHMFLWLGLGLSPEWVQAVFGVPTCAQIDTDKVALPILENPISERVRNVVNNVRKQRHRCMRLTLVRQRDKLEPVCKHFLVEDRGTDGSSSYVDFLCHMHKEIRMLLS